MSTTEFGERSQDVVPEVLPVDAVRVVVTARSWLASLIIFLLRYLRGGEGEGELVPATIA